MVILYISHFALNLYFPLRVAHCTSEVLLTTPKISAVCRISHQHAEQLGGCNLYYLK